MPLPRCKDCDGAATQWQPNWELTDEAAEWEARRGWPPDGRWTESNWPPEQPSLQLYQVRAPIAASHKSRTWIFSAGNNCPYRYADHWKLSVEHCRLHWQSR